MSPGLYVGSSPEFGDGGDINNLENILQTITYHDVSQTGPESEVTLQVTPGESYKLQLLFWRAVGARSFDMWIDGQLALDEFNPAPTGEEVNENEAFVYTYEFVAQNDVLTILFEPGTGEYDNHQPILNALTLETIRATWIPGDVDGDNVVDEEDAAVLAAHWGLSDADWEDGDFNNDDLVNAVDAAILTANWGNHTGEAQATAVPEPSAAVLLLLSMMLVAFGARRGS